MSDTPRTDFVAHAKAWANGAKDKIVQLERELAEAKTQRGLAVEALKIIGECFTTEAMFSETATAVATASMIKKVLKECGK